VTAWVRIGCTAWASVYASVTHWPSRSEPRSRRPHSEEVKGVCIEVAAWIGEGATVLKGVHVGKGVVAGTRAVVTKDVPAFTVVVGNPACMVTVLGPRIAERELAPSWN
jgi:acetyltransferase-like isoleucine patch superfamily enzyme